MGEFDPATTRSQDPAMTFDRSRGEAAVLAVAAALAGGAAATATAMAAETTPAQANVPAIYGQPLTPEQEGPWAVELHPYDGPPLAHARNTTTPIAETSDATPTDATSQQECIDDALAPMQVTNVYLKRPHNDNGKTQRAFAQASVERMPLSCLSQFDVQRHLRFEFDVQNPVHRAIWNAFLAHTLDMDDFAFDNDGQISDAFRLPDPAIINDYNKTLLGIGVYVCTPGAKKTGVKLLTEEVATDPQTNATLGQKKFPVIPVKRILPKPC